MGTAGGRRGRHVRLVWLWLTLSVLPLRPVDRSTASADRRLNREVLPWQEASWSKASAESEDYAAFYVDLHRCVMQGTAPVITPQSVRRTLAVLEKCRREQVR